MPAVILDGKAAAADLREEVRRGVEEFRLAHRRVPGLVGVQVGDDPASEIYQAGKARAAEEAGMISRRIVLPDTTGQHELDALIDELNADDSVDGMLVQLPVPDQLSEVAIANRIHPDKDVDGFSPINLGRLIRGEPGSVPCTPAGVMWMLDRAGIPIEGADAVVVGRSLIVGKPMALMLTARSATVTVAHSKTRDLPELCRSADILVAAVGRPEMIRGDWIKPGAAVIDVGINRTEAGLRGDVAGDDAREVAGWLTPVPGGVGPMTIAYLLANTLEAARRRTVGITTTGDD
ncbi:MAG TPA: bifunctional methylenetetrahydrofolate dehydrogenase/methenyltetrahydrofolate cyclohydrolase FolD [Miltoncostaeaceae bacterium]|jgi:methylenetetrahydrofolate dehydrogenase (NADP+)/methenyltetrahydrofolate cyclohydrolase|nr:bifunctional methylenetetrahydrofolate dehydrogenase/methenyltetrahydrofolate cyclohydrolase FolD [Miltoncostaeaceae bacterium]